MPHHAGDRLRPFAELQHIVEDLLFLRITDRDLLCVPGACHIHGLCGRVYNRLALRHVHVDRLYIVPRLDVYGPRPQLVRSGYETKYMIWVLSTVASYRALRLVLGCTKVEISQFWSAALCLGWPFASFPGLPVQTKMGGLVCMISLGTVRLFQVYVSCYFETTRGQSSLESQGIPTFCKKKNSLHYLGKAHEKLATTCSLVSPKKKKCKKHFRPWISHVITSIGLKGLTTANKLLWRAWILTRSPIQYNTIYPIAPVWAQRIPISLWDFIWRF